MKLALLFTYAEQLSNQMIHIIILQRKFRNEMSYYKLNVPIISNATIPMYT